MIYRLKCSICGSRWSMEARDFMQVRMDLRVLDQCIVGWHPVKAGDVEVEGDCKVRPEQDSG